MDAPLYCEILRRTLLPFLRSQFPEPNSHHFIQDNDPIENLRHELKEHLGREIKPRTKQELIDGISTFWTTVDAHKCSKYIGHLRKVIPKVIKMGGEATAY